MRYDFIAVYELIGVSLADANHVEDLVTFPSTGAHAILCSDIDERLMEHDRAYVIGGLLLEGLFGKAEEGSFEERLAHNLERLREQRRKQSTGRAFVVFEATGQVESFNPRTERELPEFIIAFEGTPKEGIRSRYESQINGLLAGLAIASENITGTRRIANSVVFLNDKGKPVYSYEFKATATGTLTTRMNVDVLESVGDSAVVLAQQRDLVRPAHLLSKSIEDENDELPSFLSAWSGIEIFVNSVFGFYEERVLGGLCQGGTPIAPRKIVGRIRDVMKDKYRLSDKFALISFELSPDTAAQDVATLERIKGIRDKLIHGGHGEVGTTLPINDTRNLLRKYLGLHIQSRRAS